MWNIGRKLATCVGITKKYFLATSINVSSLHTVQTPTSNSIFKNDLFTIENSSFNPNSLNLLWKYNNNENISKICPDLIGKNNKVINEISIGPIIEAARLIVIRRRKMRRHKLKKLRKKMRFEWAKVRQRREMRKEKAFQAQLIATIKQAEKFCAETYVKNKLDEVNSNPLPRYWKGKRLPQFIIKELVEKKNAAK